MRWSIQVPADDDAIVRRAAGNAGVSLSEYVADCAVSAAVDDLADRQVFRVSDETWDELDMILDRPPAPNPRIVELLAGPWPLDAE